MGFFSRLFFRPGHDLRVMIRNGRSLTEINCLIDKLEEVKDPSITQLLNTPGKKGRTALHFIYRRYLAAVENKNETEINENAKLLERMIQLDANPFILDAENVSVIEHALYFKPDKNRVADIVLNNERIFKAVNKNQFQRLWSLREPNKLRLKLKSELLQNLGARTETKSKKIKASLNHEIFWSNIKNQLSPEATILKSKLINSIFWTNIKDRLPPETIDKKKQNAH